MTSTCPETGVLQGLLDGALPAHEQATLTAHLETCPHCRATLDKLATDGKSYSDLARNLQQAPTDPEPGLKRVLAAADDTGPGVTQADLPADANHELPFLALSAMPGHLGRLLHYEIHSVIGRGGFGVVLKGFDERLHRMVAIKVLSPAYAAIGSARARFIREARSAAAVKNENVVAIYDVQADAQPPFLVMEIIDGISLQDKLDKHGALGVKEILRIGVQMADGLAAAHKQSLVHRDIKPANILLENGVERVKITDFGLARAVDDASMTQSGTVAGTPMYMSPEQAEGLAIDHRSDLFSLGTVLYAMCTGHPPFRATGTHAVLKRVIDAAPRPIRESNPEIPEWLADVVTKLHAKKPEDRFQTAKEVAEVLGQHLADVQAGRAPSVAPAPITMIAPTPVAHAAGSPRRRVRMAMIVLAIAAMVLLPCVILPGGLLIWLFLENAPAELDKGRDPREDDNLILMMEDPGLRVTVFSERGDQDSFSGNPREHRFNLKPGRYQVHALKNDVLVFQEWVTIEADQKKTVQVTSDWVQLFNGKDLAGWKTHHDQPGDWKVDTVSVNRGSLYCASTPLSHLFFTEKEYGDFHLRVVVKMERACDSGVFVRSQNGGWSSSPTRDHPLGYEVQIKNDPKVAEKTGTLFFHHEVLSRVKEDIHKPNDWFMLEIIARGQTFQVLVDGKKVVDFEDDGKMTSGRHRERGALALQHSPTVGGVYFKKIEIKELPPSKPAVALPSPPVPQQPTDVLKFFVGSWKMEGVIEIPKLPGGLEARASGTQTFELVADGKFLRGHDTETKGLFEILAVQSWNPQEENFQGWSFTSSGDFIGPAVGTWDAGERVLLWKETLGDLRTTQAFQFVSGNTVKVHHVHRDKKDKVVHEARQTMTRLEKPADVQRMPIDPKRPVEMKVLDRITGDWRNHLTIKNPDMPTASKPFTAFLAVRPILAGHMFECRETDEESEEQDYWLTAYDARLKKYRFWYFGAKGNVAEIDGTFDEAKKTMYWKATDKSFEGRWTFRSDDERDVAFSGKDPKGKLVHQVEGVCKRIMPKPFTLRGKDRPAEQAFDTLKEAVAKAGAGDTIEIRGNGPFVSDLVRVKKALRIRAGEGFKPVITFQHEPLGQFWLGMVEVHAPLVVEGIEFRYTRPEKGGVVQAFLVTSDLRMTNCRVVTQGETNAIGLVTGSAEIQRSEILTQRWSGIRWNFDGAAKLVVNESLIAAPEALTLHAHASRAKIHDLDVRINRSTVVGAQSMMSWLVDHVQPAPKKGRKPIQVHASDSAFFLSHPEQRMVSIEGNVEGEYQEAAKARALLEQAMSWTEVRNLYPGQSLIGLRDYKKGKLLANGYLCADLDEWCKFWGIPPTKSTQGVARFQEGDLLAKLQADIHVLTAADFRLAKGSPGQGVLPGGKDLGADVDLVGPGAGFEHWQKTPAYQEWRRQTDALLNAAAPER